MAKYTPYSMGLFALSLILLIVGAVLWANANKKPAGESKQPGLSIGIAMVIYGLLSLFGSVLSFFVRGINVGPWGAGLFTFSLIFQLIGSLLWNNANNKPEGSRQPSLGIGMALVFFGILLLFGSLSSFFIGRREIQGYLPEYPPLL